MTRSLAVIAALWPVLVHGDGQVVIRSPSSAQTYALHSIQWRQLRWVRANRSFVASITFSNLNYETRADPRRDERFDFVFPNVRLDETSGVFYVQPRKGESIPFAGINHGILGKQIDLLPGSAIELDSRDGLIHAALVTNRHPAAPQWIEHNE